MAVIAALALVAAACAAPFAQTASVALKGALDATSAARDLAVDGSKRAQEQIVEDLERSAAALPKDDPQRDAKVAAMKAEAHRRVDEIRARRDRVLDGCGRAYVAIGMAQAALPLAEIDPARKDDAIRLIGEAYKALEAAR
jgi:hypothetical protein